MQTYPNWVLEFQGRNYAIPARGLRIGRGQGNDVVLQDDQSSRHHATIWLVQGNVYIRDEGSTNGTFVRGQRITAPTALRPGDTIQIGRAVLSVRVTRGAPLAARPAVPSNQTALIVGGTGFAFLVLVGCVIVLALVLQQQPTSPSLAQRSIGGTTTSTAIVPPVTSRAPTITPLAATSALNPTSTPVPTAVPIQGDARRRALMAAVAVIVPGDKKDDGSVGSGSIIDKRGLILTNFHVVRDPDTRRPYNSRDLILVAINSTPERPPDRLFRAEIAQMDPNLDLAILKLTATADGKSLPADLGLAVIALGNSDTVQIGDRIQVIGFPDIGGNTVTLDEGVISGFLLGRAWMKTGTPVNPGNSGGMAINAAGELIGIPTIKISDPRLGGQLGLLRPINLAKPLIEKAR